MENAERVHSTGRFDELHDLRVRLDESCPISIPHLTTHRPDRHERGLARWALFLDPPMRPCRSRYDNTGITTVGASMQNGNATITVPQPAIHSSDPVPFRLTPNMQHFIGPIFTEGILATGIMSIARSLTQPDVSVPVLG